MQVSRASHGDLPSVFSSLFVVFLEVRRACLAFLKGFEIVMALVAHATHAARAAHSERSESSPEVLAGHLEASDGACWLRKCLQHEYQLYR